MLIPNPSQQKFPAAHFGDLNGLQSWSAVPIPAALGCSLLCNPIEADIKDLFEHKLDQLTPQSSVSIVKQNT